MGKILEDLLDIFMQTGIGGYSNGTGFVVRIVGEDGKLHKFGTKNYQDDENPPKNDLKTSLSSFGRFLFFTIIAITTLPFWILTFTVLRLRKRSPQWPLYHAAEHKTIILLEKNLDPTFENFKKCPKTTLACGSSQVFLSFWGLFWLFLIPITASLGWLGVAHILNFALIASFLSFYFLPAAKILEKKGFPRVFAIRIILALIGLPLTLPGLLFEKALALSEPTPEIIEEAMEVAQEIQASEEYQRLVDKNMPA